MDGVKELNRIVSMSCDKEHFYYNNRISFDEFIKLSPNIITTSACLASPLNKLPDSHPRYMELAKRYDFLEIQPHNHPEQVEFNKRLLKLAKQINKPLIAGTDTHSSTPYKAECRSVLLSAKHKSYGDEDAFDLTYKTYDELVDMFKRQNAIPEQDYMQAIENTNLLYDMTEDIELDVSIKYPILYGSREKDAEMFDKLIDELFEQKLADGIIAPEQEQSFREAIIEEKRVFHKLHMEGFMLGQSEIVRWCKEQGMAIGTARGSVGGSRVAYVLDIIDLNPEKWHTVFSRFCNEDREEIGDIDIDVVESDRPAIFQYIMDRFGTDKTARVAAFGTLQGKATIDEIGRHLAITWGKTHTEAQAKDNPWSIPKICTIKNIFENEGLEQAREQFPELFYYYDGLLNTKVSQSVHPAGMVISPITLPDNFGIFDKENELCLMLDMENVHDYTGLAKYDFLALKTVKVIRDTCDYIGVPYPKTHEIDWDDEEVWNDLITNPSAIFQFEGNFAFDCLKRYKPKSIFDMSMITAAIRPSGASYRNDLLSHKVHSNPSEIIDELLKDNLGYLIYQEDTIKFLQQICGLSGSEADNIRRAIGRKQKDRLDKAMPQILNGYCEKSPKPRTESEQEAKEFLQIIEDSANYQFGYNHSIAYCLLSYLCAYYRHYYPFEFISAFLNNAANDEDIQNGTAYANKVGIKVTMPKWGFSKSEYFYDKEKGIIAKGLASVKYMGDKMATELYELARQKKYTYFVDLLLDAVNQLKIIDARQLDILIKIDFFSEFGNQRELLRIVDMFTNVFKKGEAKKISKDKVDGTRLEPIIKKYSIGVTKSGGIAKSYTLLDIESIMKECEKLIKSIGMDDLEDIIKVQNFKDALGYVGYISGKEEDRQKLVILNRFPARRRKDNVQFGYNIITKSIGSGKEARLTIFNQLFDKCPVNTDDIILCQGFKKQNGYFTLTKYCRVV